MKALESLMEEHRVIERAASLLEDAALKLYRGETVNMEVFALLLRFFKEFTDKCHHGKEERALFPFLESKGIPREGGPIGVMLVEHDIGRRLIKALEEDLESIERDPEARRDAVDSALSYVGLIREHIFKEDNVLFKIADELMSVNEDERLVEEFEKIEINTIGSGVHEQLIKLLDEVEGILRR
jgi:hemerythrin-like domain-containing protein